MKTFHVVLTILLFIFMEGCCVYQPQATDIPLIRGKNDLRIDAGVSLVPTVHSTVSYGITDKITVQVFGSTGGEERKYFHIAPGIYKARENHVVTELYGGFGYGYGDAYNDANPGDLYGHYQLYFLQFNIGQYSTNKGHFEFGIGIKSGYFRSNFTDANYYSFGNETGPYLNYRDNSLLLESLAFLRAGSEQVKFSLKVGACRIINLSNYERYIPVLGLNVGLGINFTPKFYNKYALNQIK